MQHGRERVHVEPFESVDIAPQQRLLGVVQRLPRHVGGGVTGGGERGTGPLQGAVDRGDRASQQLGDLARRPAEHFPEDQHRPLPGCQPLQRGDERQADRLPGDGGLRRVRRGRQHPLVRYGSDPGRLGQAGADRGVHARRGGEIHRPGPALTALEQVEAHIRGDPVEPGPQGRPPLEPVVAPPGPHHRLLDGVLGLERRAQHPVAVAGQLGAVGLQPVHGLAPVHGLVPVHGLLPGRASCAAVRRPGPAVRRGFARRGPFHRGPTHPPVSRPPAHAPDATGASGTSLLLGTGLRSREPGAGEPGNRAQENPGI